MICKVKELAVGDKLISHGHKWDIFQIDDEPLGREIYLKDLAESLCVFLPKEDIATIEL